MDPNGEPVEVVDVLVDLTPTVVYNLEVDGTFTYFAQGVWVHNNSCDIDYLTPTGNYPSWGAVQQRFWKLFGMGGPPKRIAKVRYADGREGFLEVTMELHHKAGRAENQPHSLDKLVALWPWEHAKLDPSRYPGYEFIGWWD